MNYYKWVGDLDIIDPEPLSVFQARCLDIYDNGKRSNKRGAKRNALMNLMFGVDYCTTLISYDI